MKIITTLLLLLATVAVGATKELPIATVHVFLKENCPIAIYHTKTLSELYERYVKEGTDFDCSVITMPIYGYPGFITRRDTDSHEVKTRLNIRPNRWLRTQLSYQMETTDFETVTRSNIVPLSPEELKAGFDPELFALPSDTEGGRVLAGEHNSHIYGMNVVLTPWERLTLTGSF